MEEVFFLGENEFLFIVDLFSAMEKKNKFEEIYFDIYLDHLKGFRRNICTGYSESKRGRFIWGRPPSKGYGLGGSGWGYNIYSNMFANFYLNGNLLFQSQHINTFHFKPSDELLMEIQELKKSFKGFKNFTERRKVYSVG